jgi:hypothetical protein
MSLPRSPEAAAPSRLARPRGSDLTGYPGPSGDQHPHNAHPSELRFYPYCPDSDLSIRPYRSAGIDLHARWVERRKTSRTRWLVPPGSEHYGGAPVTYTNYSFAPTLRQHRGVCSRCGWAGNVSHVPLTDFQHLKSAVVFGQICDDCATDLFPSQCAPRAPAGRTGPSPRGPGFTTPRRHPAKDRGTLSLV